MMKKRPVKDVGKSITPLVGGSMSDVELIRELENAVQAIRKISLKNLLNNRTDRDTILYRLRHAIHALDLRSSVGTDNLTTPT